MEAQDAITSAARVIENIPLLLKRERELRKLSVRAAAKEIDISHTIVNRIERGASCNTDTAVLILDWIGRRNSR